MYCTCVISINFLQSCELAAGSSTFQPAFDCLERRRRRLRLLPAADKFGLAGGVVVVLSSLFCKKKLLGTYLLKTSRMLPTVPFKNELCFHFKWDAEVDSPAGLSSTLKSNLN